MSNIKTAVSFDDQAGGGVDWYDSAESANQRFDELVRESTNTEINLFEFEAPADASDDEITALADDLMWTRAYTALRSRKPASAAKGQP